MRCFAQQNVSFSAPNGKFIAVCVLQNGNPNWKSGEPLPEKTNQGRDYDEIINCER
jgi:hypothetical protein